MASTDARTGVGSTAWREALAGLSTGQRVLASAVALTTAAGLATVGTSAAFNGSLTSPAQAVTAAPNLTLDLRDGANATTILAASGLAAGDWVERPMTLRITSDLDGNGDFRVSTAASGDLASALQTEVRLCTGGSWTGTGPTYTCSGSETTVFAFRAAGTVSTPSAEASFTGNGAKNAANNLLLKVKLADSATEALAGLQGSVVYTFKAVQRDGKAVS